MRKLILAIAATFCAVSAAQIPGTGAYSHATLDNRGFDQVNVGNLNTRFTIPIVNKQGRGLPFNYVIQYEGLIWQPVNNGTTTTWVPNTNWGFNGQLNGSGVIGFLSSNVSTIRCGGPIQQGGGLYYETFTSAYAYHDPFGAVHPFNYSTNSGCAGGNNPTGPSTSGNGSSNDGSGYMLVNGSQVRTINGITISPSASVNGSPNSGAGSESDANGNQITFNGSGTFTDTTGSSALVISGSNPVQFSYPVTLQSGGATTASATLTYKSYTVRTNFGCSGVVDYGSNTAALVDHITLADGETYSFTYEGTPGATDGAVTARIASITLPTSTGTNNGVISYSYYGGPSGANGIVCADGTVPGLHRNVIVNGTNYTRTYARGGVSGNALAYTTTVTDEKNNQTWYAFSINSALGNYYETHRQVYTGSNNGSPLQETFTCYNGAAANCDGQSIGSVITEADVSQSYNGLDTVLTKNTLDSTGSFLTRSSTYGGSTLLTNTTNTYAAPGSVTELTSTTTKDGSGNTISYTGYGYDETTPIATSGVTQHSTPSSYPGNQTSVHVSIDGSTSNTLTTTTAYYDTGMPYSTAAPGNPANATSCGTGFITCYGYDATGTFQTSTTSPTPSSGVGLSTSATYDTASGAATSVTGMNSGQTFTLTKYDPLLRPMAVTTPNQGSLGQGLSDATYSPNEVDTSTAMNGSQSTFQRTYLDGYGRTVRVAVQSSSGWYLTDSCYDPAGLLQYQSTAYLSSSANPSSYNCSTSTATQYTYDGLGRITQTATPDGHTVAKMYNGRAVKIVDSNGQTRVLQKNLLGLLVGVCEFASGTWDGGDATQACGNSNTGTFDIGGNGFTTAYSYNLALHTVTVNQGAQTRVFTTDAAGRTVSSVEPESGTTTYAYSYQPQGLQVIRTRPKANQTNASSMTTTTTQYDSLGRVIVIKYTDGTPTKTFNYDQPGNGGSIPNAGASKGQLTGMSNGAHGRSYAYDIMGRVSETVECLPGWCGQPQHDLSRWYGYDLASELTSEAYVTQPNGGGAYSVAYGYNTAGQLTSFVDGQNNGANAPTIYSTTASTMQPGGPQFIAYGNNTTAYRVYDAMNRLQGQWVCGLPGGFNCPGTSHYFYGFYKNQSGSQVTSETDTVNGDTTNYFYDALGGLYNSSSATGNSGNGFSAGYDRYGNRWNETVSHTASGTGPNQTLSFNIANNQINTPGYLYDAAGNLMNDPYHNYQYDADNNLTSIDNGSSATYSFSYSALNERVAVTTPASGTVRYGFDAQGRRATQWDNSTGNVTETQYYANGQPVAFWSAADGNIHFEHQDWIGTERMRTDLAGNPATVASFSSLPFGEPNLTSGTDLNPAHYTGLDQDGSFSSTSLGLHHAMFREYSSLLGRWLSPDPYIWSYKGWDPQSLNRYSYVENNPLTRTDPTGQDYCMASDGSIISDEGDDSLNYEEGCLTSPGGGGGGNGNVWVQETPPANTVDVNGDDPSQVGGSLTGSAGMIGSSSSGTSGSSPAPSNNPGQSVSHCAGQALAKNGASLAIDGASFALNLVPGGGLVAGAAKLTATYGLGLGGTVHSALGAQSTAGFVGNLFLGSTGTAFSSAGVFGEAISATSSIAETLPIIGNIATGLATAIDVVQTGADFYHCYVGH